MFLVKLAMATLCPTIPSSPPCPTPARPRPQIIYQEVRANRQQSHAARPVVQRNRAAGAKIAIFKPRYFTIDSEGNRIPLEDVWHLFKDEDEDDENWDWEVIENPRSKPIPIERKIQWWDDDY